MKKIKVAINGFGRIGRTTFRAMMKRSGLEIVAINDLTDSKTLSYLLKYDSVHGIIDAEIGYDEQHIIVNERKIRIFSERDPGALPWKENGIDVVIESTGFLLDKASASGHLRSGAKKVIISAPSTSPDVKTIVLGVNDQLIHPDDVLFSNASCTTNCAAPMIQVLDENWTIEIGRAHV